MSIGYVRKWSDTGAPKLWSNSYGSMVRLLEAVLVNGYGSTPSLGWTKEYESTDTNTVVFRNNQDLGTGTYLQVSHSNLYGYATNFYTVAGFESMSGWNTGLNRCPPIGVQAINTIGYDTQTLCPDGIHWTIIGDSIGFWLLVRYNLSQYTDASAYGKMWRPMYIGDYIPYDPANQWNFCLSGRKTADTTRVWGNINTYGTADVQHYVMRNYTLAPGATDYGIGVGSSYEASYVGYGVDASPLNGQQLLAQITMHQYPGKFLGVLPGVRSPLRQYGVRGVSVTTLTDEIVYGVNQTLHTFLYDANSWNIPTRMCIISGEGFRNVI